MTQVAAVVAALLAVFAANSNARPFYDTRLPFFAEVDWLPESQNSHATAAFVGSPSIVKTRENDAVASVGAMYLSSHDRFFNIPKGTAYVFVSKDLVAWDHVADITPMYWAQLFVVEGVTYIIGTSSDMTTPADVVISRCLSSPCNGTAWSPPSVLFAANSTHSYHCAPTPVVQSNNQLYRAFEVNVVGVTNGNLGVFMLEGDATCKDLTFASCWAMSDIIYYDPAWAPVPEAHRTWEEAGAILHPNGTIFTMVRLDSPVEECETLEDCNRAALLRYDTQNHRLDFHSLVPFPSSCNKFAVKQHPGDGKFYSLSNPVTLVPVKNYGTGSCGQRNTVVLTQSEDLLHWKTCDVVLYDDTGLARDDSLRYTGLQYIDFIFEGDDIIAAVRAGYRGATTYHDANRLLLANVSGFAARCEA